MVKLFIDAYGGEIELLKYENNEVIMPHMGKWPMEDSKTYIYQFPEAIVGFAHPALDIYSNEVIRHFNTICNGGDIKSSLDRIECIFQKVWRQKIDYYSELREKIAPSNSELDPQWRDTSQLNSGWLCIDVDGNIYKTAGIYGVVDHGILKYRKFKKVFE